MNHCNVCGRDHSSPAFQSSLQPQRLYCYGNAYRCFFLFCETRLAVSYAQAKTAWRVGNPRTESVRNLEWKGYSCLHWKEIVDISTKRLQHLPENERQGGDLQAWDRGQISTIDRKLSCGGATGVCFGPEDIETPKNTCPWANKVCSSPTPCCAGATSILFLHPQRPLAASRKDLGQIN